MIPSYREILYSSNLSEQAIRTWMDMSQHNTEPENPTGKKKDLILSIYTYTVLKARQTEL